MSEHDAFLQTILAEPDDTGPRLVYADWLEEQGDCDRAEFLRLDTEWAALRKTDTRRREVARRLVNLFYRHGRKWDRPRLDMPAAVALASASAVVRLAPVCDTEVNLEELDLALSVLEIIPEAVARENFVLPLGRLQSIRRLVDPVPFRCRCDKGRYRGPFIERDLIVAVSQKPVDPDLIQKLEFILNSSVFWLVADRQQLVAAIDRTYGMTETESVDSILWTSPVSDSDSRGQFGI